MALPMIQISAKEKVLSTTPMRSQSSRCGAMDCGVISMDDHVGILVGDVELSGCAEVLPIICL